MKPIFLIAVNFVREQRWPIFVLLLWVLLLAFLGLATDDREDLLFVFKQVAVYAVVFSIFFGGSAIYNERKSRRILAVLSKGIGRGQYLSGLVLGVTIASGIYCFALGITGSWTLGEAGFPMSYIWFLMVSLVAACMLAGTVALMFSTLLNPFFSAGATAMLLGLPWLASHLISADWGYVIPVVSLTMTTMNASFTSPVTVSWLPITLAVGDTLVFWALAGWIFSRVDIAVAVE
jgi:ABC-type transport system involved in multi-copper enzyme maturation permease subunit